MLPPEEDVASAVKRTEAIEVFDPHHVPAHARLTVLGCGDVVVGVAC
jgi:hypothetical protein